MDVKDVKTLDDAIDFFNEEIAGPMIDVHGNVHVVMPIFR